MPDATVPGPPRLPHLPDDWMVWAFSDSHGVTSALVAALGEAGIVDGEGHWCAPPRTALVGCGDYIDRGGDVRGMVELLMRLGEEAPRHGGLALFARGNHEEMARMIGAGQPGWHPEWLHYGGLATLGAYGLEVPEAHDPARAPGHLASAAAELLAWIDGLPHAVRWRDVLFVHGGLAPGFAPTDLGTRTDEHLWIRAAFFESPWSADAWAGYRRAGVDRVVFGHTPQREGARTWQGGHSLAIDSNAVANDTMPRDAVRQLTLVRLSGDERLDRAPMVVIPTAHAPDLRRR